MKQHTKEPWYWTYTDDNRLIVEHDEREAIILEINTYSKNGRPIEEDEANAERITTCINNCKGINPEVVLDLINRLQEVTDLLEAWWEGAGSPPHSTELAIGDAKALITKATQ